MNNKINFNKIIITFFGVGLLPIAPGTFGSLAGLLLGIIAFSINNIAIFILIPILFVTGIICSNIHQNKTGKKDDSIIVIDEVVGQLIAMIYAKDNIELIIISFIIFRIFDIIKPWPASYADKKIDGGLGVMLDDVFCRTLCCYSYNRNGVLYKQCLIIHP